MRNIRFMAVIVVMLVAVATVATAGHNMFGVADMQKITFIDPIRVGEVLLPQGNYEVRHVMEGDNHIMVFKQLNVNKPVQARVQCSLVKLAAKAEQTQKIYVVSTNNERILRELIFRGDTAKHVF